MTRMKNSSYDDIMTIAGALLSDTPEMLKLETIRGAEDKYEDILFALEFPIATYYIRHPEIKDSDVVYVMKNIMKNYEDAITLGSELEVSVKVSSFAAITSNPITKHEFILCIERVLDAISDRSWVPDKRAYLNWIANFFEMLEGDKKKQFDAFYSRICRELGMEEGVFTKGKKASGALKLEKTGENEWRFVFPESWDTAAMVVYDALERLESSKAKEREEGAALLKDAVQIAPEHPLTLSQYGFFLCETEKTLDGSRFIQKVVGNSKKLFPKNFSAGKDRLEWLWLENRPFLRCLHWLGLEEMKKQNFEEALRIFNEILGFNPNDNQGVRCIIAECLLALKRPADVIELCNKYKDDYMPEISYNKSLALFQLGRKEEAEKTLKEAIKQTPLVAAELVKPSKNRQTNFEFIEVGGKSEAWEYCNHFENYWKQTDGAMDFLRDLIDAE